MKLAELLEIVADEPVFETGLLLAGDVDPNDVRRQLSRWVTARKVIQVRRGLYALARPYARRQPHPFELANRLTRPSYVSLQSALGYHGLIPEFVPVTTSVTTGRPGRFTTPLGRYTFRHIKPSAWFGYGEQRLGLGGERAFVADAPKALADLVYLEPNADTTAYLDELRLDLARFDIDGFGQIAERMRSPKLMRAAKRLARLRAAAVGNLRELAG